MFEIAEEQRRDSAPAGRTEKSSSAPINKAGEKKVVYMVFTLIKWRAECQPVDMLGRLHLVQKKYWAYYLFIIYLMQLFEESKCTEV